MKTTTDFLGFTVIADGVDAGRYATAEVAAQAYCEDLYGYISDASKDATGRRFRMDISGMTFAELEAECNYWEIEVEVTIRAEKLAADRAVTEFKALVTRTIWMGAKDEETALRWISDSQDFYHPQDVEHFVWKQGILFTDYGKDLVKKLYNIVTYKEVA